MTEPKSLAGGRATAAGLDFQAGVGLWFAAYLVSQMPVGARFGLKQDALPVELRFETGAHLDDIQIRLKDGGGIFVQCKTHPSLSASAESDLSSTVKQLVSLYISSQSGDVGLELSRSAAVLAVMQDAARTLDDLENVCRFYDLGGQWGDPQSVLNQAQRAAADIFETLVRQSWDEVKGGALTREHLVELARLFHIKRFDVGTGHADFRDASQLLGSRLFGREDAGDGPLNALLNAVRRLIKSGGPSDASGLINAIRSEGFSDTQSPRFGLDVDRLKATTVRELQRLSRHARLPIAGGVPIARECIAPFSIAVEGGSLLVTGEPGAGKTGVLVSFVEKKNAARSPVVFLSVDRFTGINKLDDLRVELNLEHPLLDILQGWPGTMPGYLVIDALDASRGGPSERIFATLIEDALSLVGERWSVVASIRTFDLRNGKSYRIVMAGEPPDRSFVEPDLNDVRHFKVPLLSKADLDAAAKADARLESLEAHAPLQVKELLGNVFNLSLAAELVDRGVASESIRTVTTQSELIEKYENERLPTAKLRVALRDVVSAMVQHRRLAIRKALISHEELDDLIGTGVLSEAGDKIAFSHHILFDHAAGRLYLDWDDAARLRQQVAGDPEVGFLLGPALRFAMERVWRDDLPGRTRTWRLIADFASTDRLDPIVASVALRTAAQSVAGPKDIGGLLELIKTGDVNSKLGSALARLASFVSMSIKEASSLNSETGTAWALVAEQAIETKNGVFADAARMVLWALSDRADLSEGELATAFGRSARKLLTLAWSDSALGVLAPQVIRFVTKTFATDPVASRLLLQQILEEPRFSKHAHEEGGWLAEGVLTIAASDPQFAAEIYDRLFSHQAPTDEKTWMGGRPSRILPLVSNAKQDYEHARWRLRQALPEFLKIAPALATRAVSRAVIGMSHESYLHTGTKTYSVPVGTSTLSVTEDDKYPQEWRKRGRALRSSPEDEVLGSFADFVEGCEPEVFRQVVGVAIGEDTASSVWARLLGTAAQRPEVVDGRLWQVASSPGLLEIPGVSRDAVIYLTAVYAERSKEERAGFESAIVARLPKGDEHSWLQSVAARLLSGFRDEDLATAQFRELKEELRAANQLTGNPPLVTIESGWGRGGDITDTLLEHSGVNLKEGPDLELRNTTRLLDEGLRSFIESANKSQVAALWALSSRVIEEIDSLSDPPPHPDLLHASWGAVSNAIDKIAGAESYDPTSKEHPAISAMLEVIDRLAKSEYPAAHDDGESDLMAWGNWDVRVYAASSLMSLARRFGGNIQAIIDRLPKLLSDPAPNVRLQIAQSLNTLWEIARPEMWAMIEQAAREETHNGVLGFFVAGPLSRLAWAASEQVEAIVDQLLRRPPLGDLPKDGEKREDVQRALGGIAAQLWVGKGRTHAKGWIDGWIADPRAGAGYLWSILAVCRMAFFEEYKPKKIPDAKGIQDRAKRMLHEIVVSAAAQIDRAHALSLASAVGPEKELAEQLYKVGDQLLDHCCNELYFGSGVFESQNGQRKESGLSAPEDMRAFLRDYREILEIIGRSGSARTLHHLIELYEYLSPAAPAEVFDRLSNLLVGPASREGYHFESLGSDALVRVVRRYLADYRFVFDEPVRRAQLVLVLELFSSVGWAEALKLLYDLPEVLR
jgi:hypothetical protein